MPNVNLIQEQQNAARLAERQTKGFFFIFLFTLAVSLGASGFLFLQTESAQSQESALKRKLVRLQPIMSQIEHNQTELAALTPKLTTLTDAQGAVQKWSRILDHLATSAPEGLWLTSIRCRRANATEPIVLSTTGQTHSQESVGDLISRMQFCQELENVKLKYTQADYSEGEQKIKFEVLADVADTAEKPPAKSKSKGKTDAKEDKP